MNTVKATPCNPYYIVRTTLDFTKSNAKMVDSDGRPLDYQAVTIEYQARRMDDDEIELMQKMLDGFSPELIEVGMIRIFDLFADLSLIQIVKDAKRSK